MTTTISRARVRRGERSYTRVRVADDSTAPKRRRLSRPSGTVADLLTRPARARKSRVATITKSKRRSRPRVGGIGVPEPGRDGLGASLANTVVGRRRRSTGPGARAPSREAAKLGRIRDGRYARSRSRFVV